MRGILLTIGCLPLLLWLGFWIGVIYIGLHFLAKFW